MKSNTETYVHITVGTGDDATDSVKPEKQVEKMTKEGKQFTEVSRQAYAISEFESLGEFETLATSDGQRVSDEVKLDMINRAWILRQQQTARANILSEDRTPSDSPIDLLDEAVSPRERRTASTESKAKNNLQKLAKENPEAFAALLAEFQAAV
jgi:hypothetical protein